MQRPFTADIQRSTMRNAVIKKGCGTNIQGDHSGYLHRFHDKTNLVVAGKNKVSLRNTIPS